MSTYGKFNIYDPTARVRSNMDFFLADVMSEGVNEHV